MPVEMDCTIMDPMPAAKGIVAQHDALTIDNYLAHYFRLRRPGKTQGPARIVVANNKMLTTVQPAKQPRQGDLVKAKGEVTEMPDFVLPPDSSR